MQVRRLMETGEASVHINKFNIVHEFSDSLRKAIFALDYAECITSASI